MSSEEEPRKRTAHAPSERMRYAISHYESLKTKDFTIANLITEEIGSDELLAGYAYITDLLVKTITLELEVPLDVQIETLRNIAETMTKNNL